MLSTPAKVANNALKAGEYKLKVEGSTAVFTGVDSDKTDTAPIRSENVPKKFDVTAVDTRMKGDAGRIQSIELGGTTTRIDFSDSE